MNAFSRQKTTLMQAEMLALQSLRPNFLLSHYRLKIKQLDKMRREKLPC